MEGNKTGGTTPEARKKYFQEYFDNHSKIVDNNKVLQEELEERKAIKETFKESKARSKAK